MAWTPVDYKKTFDLEGEHWVRGADKNYSDAKKTGIKDELPGVGGHKEGHKQKKPEVPLGPGWKGGWVLRLT